ncbi:hypothetical protein MTO96_005465 [Rhipicephalus appendiculatus]
MRFAAGRAAAPPSAEEISTEPSVVVRLANRTYLDLEQKKASYVWELKGDGSSAKRNITVYWQEGEAPDLPSYYIDYDPTHSHIAHAFYTDYSTCVVMKMSFLGHDQCMLWVKPDVVDDIPRHCRHNYKRHCQVRYPTYDKELCKEN